MKPRSGLGAASVDGDRALANELLEQALGEPRKASAQKAVEAPALAIRIDFQPRPSAADVVVEATGSTSGLQMAIEAVRPRGTLVLKSTVAADHALSLAPLVINEVTVVGSRCGPFAPALRALAHNRVAVTPLIDQAYPLTAASDAVAHAARPGTLKILLRQA